MEKETIALTSSIIWLRQQSSFVKFSMRCGGVEQ